MCDMSEKAGMYVYEGVEQIDKVVDFGLSRPTPTCLVTIGCRDARSMDEVEQLDDIIALDGACGTGTSRGFTCPCPNIIRGKRRLPLRFAETVSDVLDLPRASTLTLHREYTTPWSDSRCLALQIAPCLSAYQECCAKRHKHERSCEAENRFGETQDSSRIDRAKDERL